MVSLLTVGHGPQDRAALGARLTAAGIGQLVDVRRFPGSRNNPDVAREELERWLPGLGIGYRWEERLGGRRRLRQGSRSRTAGGPSRNSPPTPPTPGRLRSRTHWTRCS